MVDVAVACRRRSCVDARRGGRRGRGVAQPDEAAGAERAGEAAGLGGADGRARARPRSRRATSPAGQKAPRPAPLRYMPSSDGGQLGDLLAVEQHGRAAPASGTGARARSRPARAGRASIVAVPRGLPAALLARDPAPRAAAAGPSRRSRRRAGSARTTRLAAGAGRAVAAVEGSRRGCRPRRRAPCCAGSRPGAPRARSRRRAPTGSKLGGGVELIGGGGRDRVVELVELAGVERVEVGGEPLLPGLLGTRVDLLGDVAGRGAGERLAQVVAGEAVDAEEGDRLALDALGEPLERRAGDRRSRSGRRAARAGWRGSRAMTTRVPSGVAGQGRSPSVARRSRPSARAAPDQRDQQDRAARSPPAPSPATWISRERAGAEVDDPAGDQHREQRRLAAADERPDAVERPRGRRSRPRTATRRPRRGRSGSRPPARSRAPRRGTPASSAARPTPARRRSSTTNSRAGPERDHRDRDQDQRRDRERDLVGARAPSRTAAQSTGLRPASASSASHSGTAITNQARPGSAEREHAGGGEQQADADRSTRHGGGPSSARRAAARREREREGEHEERHRGLLEGALGEERGGQVGQADERRDRDAAAPPAAARARRAPSAR